MLLNSEFQLEKFSKWKVLLKSEITQVFAFAKCSETLTHSRR